MNADIHVLPVGDLVDHDERPDCWCQPHIAAVCPECEDRAEPAGCWRCEGAGIVARESAPDGPALVLHNAADGRQ